MMVIGSRRAEPGPCSVALRGAVRAGCGASGGRLLCVVVLGWGCDPMWAVVVGLLAVPLRGGVPIGPIKVDPFGK